MKPKIIIWIIDLGLVGLVMKQNWEFFMSQLALNLTVYHTRFHFPDPPVAVLFFACFYFRLVDIQPVFLYRAFWDQAENEKTS